MTTLKERHAAVHEAIMAGPNAELQSWIDSGDAWMLEGHVGRTAAAALTDGACVLPAVAHRDYWGNQVPSYEMVSDKVGSPGSVANAEEFDSD